MYGPSSTLSDPPHFPIRKTIPMREALCKPGVLGSGRGGAHAEAPDIVVCPG